MIVLIFLFIFAIVTIVTIGKIERFQNEDDAYETLYEEIDGFLDHDECDELIRAAINKGMEDSQVGAGGPGDPIKTDKSARKSEQTWFDGGEHAVTDKIRRKTKELLKKKKCANVKHDFESIQVARYDEGGYYYEHYDGTKCTDTCPKDQRFATLLVYLEAPESGGTTKFPLLDVEVVPKKGNALFFWGADPKSGEIIEKSLHGGMPVESGTKWIANQWVRNA